MACEKGQRREVERISGPWLSGTAGSRDIAVGKKFLGKDCGERSRMVADGTALQTRTCSLASMAHRKPLQVVHLPWLLQPYISIVAFCTSPNSRNDGGKIYSSLESTTASAAPAASGTIAISAASIATGTIATPVTTVALAAPIAILLLSDASIYVVIAASPSTSTTTTAPTATKLLPSPTAQVPPFEK